MKFDRLQVFSGITGSLTGSVTSAETASYFTGGIEFPNGLVVTGSITATAGFTGSISGNITNANSAISSSYALTSSYALNSDISGLSVSSSWASSSVSSSFATTASFANASNFNNLINRPNNLISSSAQINSLPNVSASWASRSLSSSLADSVLWGNIQNIPGGLVSSSTQATSWTVASSSVATSASWANSSSFLNLTNRPTGLVSSSAQASSWTVASSSVSTSSSYALTASYALNSGGGGVSSSYALSSSFAQTAATASYISGNINFPNGLVVTGSVIATSGFTGSLLGTSSNAVSSSYALTASYALNGGGGGVSSSYALTSSYATNAQNAVTASYIDGTVDFPNGLVITGSLVVTGGVTGSISGNISNADSAVSSSYALTASYATQAVSASFTNTASFANVSNFNNLVNIPFGLVSSSTQASNWTVASSSISEVSKVLSGSWQYQTIYNVQQFGATGQINQDARPFIQAAINSASLNNGGIVFLPKGTYSISSSLFMSNSIALVGEGVDATILRSATEGTGLSFSGSAMISGSDVLWSYIGNMTIRGVGIDGATCTGIYYTNGTRETHDHNVIERVFMDGMSTYGIHWNNALGGRISQVRINNTGGDAVRIIGGTALSLHEVYANGSVYNGFFLSGITYSGFYNTAADSCRTAYRLVGIRNVFFNGCGGEAVASAIGDPDRPGKYFWVSNSRGLTLDSCYASGFVDTNSTTRTYLEVDNSQNIVVSAFRGVTGSYGNNPSYRYSVTSGSSVTINYSDFFGPSNTALEASASVISLDVNGITTYSNLLNASASYALTASYALNGGTGQPSESSSWASSSLSSSFASTSTFAQTAATASYISGAIDFPSGFTISGSLIVLGGITGSISGNIGNADSAISSSYALTASYALNGGSGGQTVSSSWASSSISSSFAETASFANVSNFNNLINKPTLVSSSGQISYTGLLDIPAGIVSSSQQASTWTVASSSVATSASWANSSNFNNLINIPTGLVSSSAQATSWTVASSSVATSASWANSSNFNNLINRPTGLVSSSAQATSWTVASSSVATSSSYALTASYALNGGGGGVSSSYALTASFAQTASTASYIDGTVDFPNGLVVTGSVTATTGFTGSLQGTSSYALNTPPLSVYTASLTSEVTMSASNVFYSGSSTSNRLVVSLDSGTYLVNSHMTFRRTATTARTYTSILGILGGSVFASGSLYMPSVNPSLATIALTGIVTVTSGSQLYLAGATSAGSTSESIQSNTQTSLNALRLY
jgi:uncharacterized integral membrane protein